MKDKIDIYNAKLLVEVKAIRAAIKSEIKGKAWNITISPTIYNSQHPEYTAVNIQKSKANNS